MIEFLLLFSLGFLAAALVGLIVAPIIQRRVVTLTERRMRASVPLSSAEIKAEKDMARAAYAAENARLSVDLRQTHNDLSEQLARGVRLSGELVTLRAEKTAAEQTLDERGNEIRSLTSELHQRDDRITTLTGNLGAAIRLAEARKHEIANRDDQINRLGAEIEELRIDLVTLDTEAENFKAQMRELRDERRVLRDQLKEAETRNRDLQTHFKRSEESLAETREKLAKAISALTDRENALERRIAEVERYKQINREQASELRTAKRAARDARSGDRAARPPETGVAAPAPAKPADEPARQPEPVAKLPEPVAKLPEPMASPASPPAPAPVPAAQPKPRDIEPVEDDASDAEKVDRLRARQAALIERLLKADNGSKDAALRKEIASIAAMMVELTASREGPSSPIAKILSGSEDANRSARSESSLAARARTLISASR